MTALGASPLGRSDTPENKVARNVSAHQGGTAATSTKGLKVLQ